MSILFGLFAVAIPVIVHLLNRRRFDVVDWAAMQFLELSPKTRRKIFVEDYLILLVRIALIVLLVIAMTSPEIATSRRLSFASGPPRDIVLMIDGSASMGYVIDGKSAHQAAVEAAKEYLEQLPPGDAVGMIQARQRPVAIVPLLSTDREMLRQSLEKLPPPGGGVNWPDAVQFALQMLKSSTRNREIVLFTDGQKQGWSDGRSRERWELLAGNAVLSANAPTIRVVNVTPGRAGDLPNFSLGPILSSRKVAPVGREVRFRSELKRFGSAETDLPKRIHLEIDNRPAGELKPLNTAAGGPRLPLNFSQRFASAGSHLVSVVIDDDPLPADNRRDFVLEVVSAVPVLIIDGEPVGAKPRASDFLRDALSPAKDRTPSFLVRVLSAAEFRVDSLNRPLTSDPASLPRVLVLSDVANLSPEQNRAVEEFLRTGGGVLMTTGTRTEPDFWNENAWRRGKGWLPAKVGPLKGDEKDLAKAPTIVPESLEHPALELFRGNDPRGLASAWFPRWHPLEIVADEGVAIALLSNRQPLFVEKTLGSGRVILSAVPFDGSLRSNLTDLGDFVRMSHELIYWLANVRGGDTDLEPGQPLSYRPSEADAPNPVTVEMPGGSSKRFPVRDWPFIFEDTTEPGPYRITTESGRSRWYAVQPDPAESQLAPLTEEDRRAVGKYFPTMKYSEVGDPHNADESAEGSRLSLWGWLLAGVIGLLFLESGVLRKATF